MKNKLLTSLIAPTLSNFFSAGDVYHLAFASIEHLSRISFSIVGIEVEKFGKKPNRNEFFKETVEWNGSNFPACTSSCPHSDLPCLHLQVPLTLPASCLNKQLAVEVFYELQVEVDVKEHTEGKNIPAHQETFVDTLVLVSRTPEQPAGQISKVSTKAAQMGHSTTVEGSGNTVPVNVEFSLDKNFFCFGDTVRLNLYIDNDSEETINSIKFSLLQMWHFESAQKKNTQVLIKDVSHTFENPLPPSKVHKEVIPFELPALNTEVLPTIRGVSHFRLEYTIQAEFQFSNFKAVSPIARANVFLYSLSRDSPVDETQWKKLYASANQLQGGSNRLLSFMKGKFSH